MMRSFTRMEISTARILGVLVGSLLCCAGCSDEPRPSVYVVEGKLLIGEQPAGNASVAFHPAGDPKKAAVCPVGITADDGSFHLTTFAPDDGAPAGEYVVTLIWHDASAPVDECECINPAQHDLLRGRYADARQSTLHATVDPQQNVITLHAEKVDAPAPL